jgi:nitroimidazol reductase NimA-like FMN-containing flavoprotein (pyridoxamine 5'-phosphate oxidase superfamily)
VIVTHFDIPKDVQAVFQEFRTAELTTIAKDGTPITWPLTVVFRPERGHFAAATSIGLPQKAFNIRRNPRVSLLFSEPHASGLTKPPAVLVQGDAQSVDNITTLAGIEDVWEKIYRFQPAAKGMSSSPVTRYLMDWYYMRLQMIIVPTRILWWQHGDFSRKPVEVAHVG